MRTTEVWGLGGFSRHNIPSKEILTTLPRSTESSRRRSSYLAQRRKLDRLTRVWRAVRVKRGEWRAWLYDNVVMTPPAAFIISAGAVVIGGLAEFRTEAIESATRMAIFGPRGRTDWLTVVFWSVLVLWTWFLYYRLRGDDRQQSSRFHGLVAAIHRAPSPDVFTDYPDYYGRAAHIIGATHVPGESDDIRRKAVIAGIRDVLRVTGTLAAHFSGAPSSRVFGANVMLFAKPPLHQSLKDRLIFFDRSNGSSDSLQGVLYLVEPLLVPDTNVEAEVTDAARSRVPLIALPVPHEPSDHRGHRLALPGGPTAFLTGRQDAQNDTRELVEECAAFPAGIQDEIQEYFGPNGAGSGIRSFVSFRIGDSKDPIGVLNIDCGDTFLLGSEPEYHKTFYALMAPILRLLRKPVLEYVSLTQPVAS